LYNIAAGLLHNSKGIRDTYLHLFRNLSLTEKGDIIVLLQDFRDLEFSTKQYQYYDFDSIAELLNRIMNQTKDSEIVILHKTLVKNKLNAENTCFYDEFLNTTKEMTETYNQEYKYQIEMRRRRSGNPFSSGYYGLGNNYITKY